MIVVSAPSVLSLGFEENYLGECKRAIKKRMVISMQRLPHTLFSSLILNPSVSSENVSRQCGLGLMPARCHVWVEFGVDSRTAPMVFLQVLRFSFLPELFIYFIYLK